jgi:hypothetical protein
MTVIRRAGRPLSPANATPCCIRLSPSPPIGQRGPFLGGALRGVCTGTPVYRHTCAHASTTTGGSRSMPVRRIPRTRTRAEHWSGELSKTQSGDQALTDAWRWFRKEIATLAETNPEAAEAARWDMARQLAQYAARVPRARIALRRGLIESEVWSLRHPWERPDGGPK